MYPRNSSGASVITAARQDEGSLSLRPQMIAGANASTGQIITAWTSQDPRLSGRQKQSLGGMSARSHGPESSPVAHHREVKSIPVPIEVCLSKENTSNNIETKDSEAIGKVERRSLGTHYLTQKEFVDSNLKELVEYQKKELSQAQSKIFELEAQLRIIQKETRDTSRKDAELQKKDDELADLRRKLKAETDEKISFKVRLDSLKEQVEHGFEKSNPEISRVNDELARRTADLERMHDDLAAMRQENNKLVKQIEDNKKRDQDNRKKSEELALKENRLISKEASLQQKQSRLDQIHASEEELRAQAGDLDAQRDNLKHMEAQSKADLDRKSREFDDYKRTMVREFEEQKKVWHNDMERQRKELESGGESLRTKLTNALEELQARDCAMEELYEQMHVMDEDLSQARNRENLFKPGQFAKLIQDFDNNHAAWLSVENGNLMTQLAVAKSELEELRTQQR